MVFEWPSMRMNSNLSLSEARGTSSLACGSVMRIIGIVAVLFLTGNSAFGQFLVNPATVRKVLSPGRSDVLATSINSMMEESLTIDLRLVDLTQGADGAWEVIEPDDPNADRTGLKSCRSWLTLQEDTITLEPSQMTSVRAQIKVPRGEWGYYFAAIVAAPQPREGAATSRIESTFNINMVIPIVVQVRGRALRSDISLAGLGLHYQRQTADTMPATLVHMMIDNKGTTFSSIQGIARISRKVGGYWRRLEEVQFPPQGEQGIIPNVLLDMTQDVGRPLPPGEYKLEGFLMVDSRRADQIEQIVTFSGDPRASQDIVEGTTLDLVPLEVTLENASPGRPRFCSILVANASEQEVTVDVTAALPEHMFNATLPWMRQGQYISGQHFDCSQWLTVEPSQFTIDSYGRRNVKIRCEIPETAMPLAQYFSILKFRARFPNGQDAGTTQEHLYLDNSATEPTVETMIRQLRVSSLDAMNYTVTADCLNLSDARFLPRCRGVVRTTGLNQANVREFEMASDVFYQESGPLLPMEPRSFTGILNIAALDPGTYLLFVQLDNDLGGDPTSDYKGIEVVEENGVKSIVERDLDDIGDVIELRLQ